jgi:hypothetical protein
VFKQHETELTHDQLGWLRNAFPAGSARMWASSQVLPEPGDFAWFHRDRMVFAIVRIDVSFRNPALAHGLWQAPANWETAGDWGGIFAFPERQPASICKRAINQVLGYSENFRWQGARWIQDTHSAKLISHLSWSLGVPVTS